MMLWPFGLVFLKWITYNNNVMLEGNIGILSSPIFLLMTWHFDCRPSASKGDNLSEGPSGEMKGWLKMHIAQSKSSYHCYSNL